MGSGDASAQVKSLVERQIAEGRNLGVQVSAYLHGEPVVDVAAGQMGPENPSPVLPDTLFCSWSTGKGVAATALLILADRGVIDYEAPVAKYWPEFGVHGKDQVTVAQAAAHMTGLHAVPQPLTLEFIEDWDGALDWIAAQEPVHQPGTESRYHALTWGWVIGGIIEKADGRHIKQVLAEEIAAPLDVAGEMFFGIPDGVEDRLATLEVGTFNTGAVPLPPDSDFFEAVPNNIPVDWNSLRYRRACFPSANGHFSARSLARMYGALANGGELGGVRLVTEDRVDTCYQVITSLPDPVLMGLPMPKSAGFVMGGVWMEGFPVSIIGPRDTAFGFSGAGGSLAWADPEIGLSAAITVNKMQPEFTDTLPGAPAYEIAELIRSSLGVE